MKTILLLSIAMLASCVTRDGINIPDKYWQLDMLINGSVIPDEQDHECLEAGCDKYPIVTIRDGEPTGEYERVYGGGDEL